MRVSFFFFLRRPFYSFSLMVWIVLFRSRGRAGRAVVCWFSGRSATVPSRDGNRWEGVVKMSCVSSVWRRRWFLCRRCK